MGLLRGSALLLLLLLLTACAGPPTAADRAGALVVPPASRGMPVGGVLAGGAVDSTTRDLATSRAEAAVVRVRNRTCDGLATGSGFMISPTRLVTNKHVVRGAHQLSIDASDGTQRTVDVASTAQDDDLAVVTLSQPLPHVVELGSTDPDPGTLVSALGFPLGGSLAREDGRVLDVADGARFGTSGNVVRTTAVIRPGNSGGPLVDTSGRVRGVVFAVELANGNGLALPLTRLRAVLDAGALTALDTSCEPADNG